MTHENFDYVFVKPNLRTFFKSGIKAKHTAPRAAILHRPFREALELPKKRATFANQVAFAGPSIDTPELSTTFGSPRRNRLKRLMDVAGAGTAIILLSPLLIGIAIAVKANSKGPVYFRQQRHGLNGKIFTILKFRTMYAEKCDPTGVEQTVKDDYRITIVGRFLRKSNFDELPQLINVLRGEMSLVGPRPHVPGMLAAGVPYEEFDPRYMDRHSVTPGITGLAQVEGYRGATKDPEAALKRLEHDLAYIESQSFWLDVKILGKTIVREFFRGNGY